MPRRRCSRRPPASAAAQPRTSSSPARSVSTSAGDERSNLPERVAAANSLDRTSKRAPAARLAQKIGAARTRCRHPLAGTGPRRRHRPRAAADQVVRVRPDRASSGSDCPARGTEVRWPLSPYPTHSGADFGNNRRAGHPRSAGRPATRSHGREAASTRPRASRSPPQIRAQRARRWPPAAAPAPAAGKIQSSADGAPATAPLMWSKPPRVMHRLASTPSSSQSRAAARFARTPRSGRGGRGAAGPAPGARISPSRSHAGEPGTRQLEHVGVGKLADASEPRSANCSLQGCSSCFRARIVSARPAPPVRAPIRSG